MLKGSCFSPCDSQALKPAQCNFLAVHFVDIEVCEVYPQSSKSLLSIGLSF